VFDFPIVNDFLVKNVPQINMLGGDPNAIASGLSGPMAMGGVGGGMSMGGLG
jgi:hypothetical protein